MIYIQRQLGHSVITTTIELYGHLEEGFLRDAARRAEQAVWGQPPARVTTAVTTGSAAAGSD